MITYGFYHLVCSNGTKENCRKIGIANILNVKHKHYYLNGTTNSGGLVLQKCDCVFNGDSRLTKDEPVTGCFLFVSMAV